MPLDVTAGHRKVLLVTADGDYLSALRAGLRAAGLRPVGAATPMAALDVTDKTPAIGLFVVDFDTLPATLHAVAFARMMKARNRAAKVILAVRHADDTAPLDEQERGTFDGVVVKGDPAAALAAILGAAGAAQRSALPGAAQGSPSRFRMAVGTPRFPAGGPGRAVYPLTRHTFPQGCTA